MEQCPGAIELVTLGASATRVPLPPVVRRNLSWHDSDDQDKVGCELSKGTAEHGIFARLGRKAYFGYCAQYFAVGIILGGISATTYPVFLGYLNVPGYVYATVSVVITMPWSLKFFFGVMNDLVPIRGLRRKPYMMIGWALCALAFLILALMPLPDPYWCIDEKTGHYMIKETLPNGDTVAAKPCHPDAAKAGGKYAMLLMFGALGYVIADVAADGLTTEYAMSEGLSVRGSTQTSAYIMRTLGQAVASLTTGLCMNSKRYGGNFDWGLSFEQVAFSFSIPAMVMVPISALMVAESPKLSDDGRVQRQSCTEYFNMCWDLTKSKAFFFSILFSFFSPMVSNISTTAGAKVKMNWAGVQPLQNQMFSLVGSLLFILGLWLVKTKLLNTNWRWMLLTTTVFLQIVDIPFTTLTIFDVVRNQYFYLGETVLVEVPAAAHFVMSTFIVVEMADKGNEGMVYGLMTSTGNLGTPFAQAISNQIFGSFEPSLSDVNNYIEDKHSFRWVVFFSFLLSYAFSFSSLFFLYLLPAQKEDAQVRKRTWSRRPVYGFITVIMLTSAFCYSLAVNIMSMMPSTMCMRFAGGDGCDKSE